MNDIKNEFSWPPLECDAEIFNSYMEDLGYLGNAKFEEIFSFDVEFDKTKDILAILALYQCEKSKGQSKVILEELIKYNEVDFFIRQVKGLDKACGLVAMLNCFGNVNDKNFKENSIFL